VTTSRRDDDTRRLLGIVGNPEVTNTAKRALLTALLLLAAVCLMRVLRQSGPEGTSPRSKRIAWSVGASVVVSGMLVANIHAIGQLLQH